MSQAAADLADDIETLRAIISAQTGQLAKQAERLQSRDALIEKLKAQLAVLRRARFGTSSEKIERAIAQLELALEDIEAAAAETAPPRPRRRSRRQERTRQSRSPHASLCPIISHAMKCCTRRATAQRPQH